MSDLQDLENDLKQAAEQGAVAAGHSAIQAGVDFNDSAPRALLHVEHIGAQFTGPLSAQVTASQPAGVSAAGPILPSTGRTAEIMADTAADAGTREVLGDRRHR